MNRIRYSLRVLLLVPVVVGGILVFWLVYLQPRINLENRRQRTVESLHWSGGGEADQRRRLANLQAVKQATHATLSRLQLASVVAGNGSMVVDWVADKPIAQGLSILFSDGDTVDFQFDSLYQELNSLEAGRSVLFTGVVQAEQIGSALWVRITKDKNVRAVLIVDGKKVSNSLQPDFVDANKGQRQSAVAEAPASPREGANQ